MVIIIIILSLYMQASIERRSSLVGGASVGTARAVCLK